AKGEPLRHRQTKEAANRYVQPTATAPHLDSTDKLVFPDIDLSAVRTSIALIATLTLLYGLIWEAE
ncbi:DUF5985 family protein, partial [Bradyrhizobium sp. LB11.1]|uniref:DUF5985 family protein n=1 Tax=Bradyrhizobium sp. LB11.1 TaxID=3156326 RepID=UPI00339AB422